MDDCLGYENEWFRRLGHCPLITECLRCLLDLPIDKKGKAASYVALDVKHGHAHLVEKLHSFLLVLLGLVLELLLSDFS